MQTINGTHTPTSVASSCAEQDSFFRTLVRIIPAPPSNSGTCLFLVPLPVDKGLRQDSQTLVMLVQGIATRWHWICYKMQGDGLGTKEVHLY